MYQVLLTFFIIILFLRSYIKNKLNLNRKVLISIEGNIGVGKTSMMRLLKNKYLDVAEFIYEPVDEWLNIKDENDNNLLDIFYKDKERWAYTFQNIAYITRMNLIIDKIINSDKRIIIIDRSLQADLNTFAKMLYDDGVLNLVEWNAYNKWNNFFEKNYGFMVNHKILYLRCQPSIAYERMQMRGRGEEKNVSFSYLELLHKYHDNWLLNNVNALIVDVSDDFITDKHNFNSIYHKIENFINL